MTSPTVLPVARQVGKLGHVFPKEAFFHFLLFSLKALQVVRGADTTILCHFFNPELGFQIHPAPVCILEETFYI